MVGGQECQAQTSPLRGGMAAADTRSPRMKHLCCQAVATQFGGGDVAFRSPPARVPPPSQGHPPRTRPSRSQWSRLPSPAPQGHPPRTRDRVVRVEPLCPHRPGRTPASYSTESFAWSRLPSTSERVLVDPSLFRCGGDGRGPGPCTHATGSPQRTPWAFLPFFRTMHRAAAAWGRGVVVTHDASGRASPVPVTNPHSGHQASPHAGHGQNAPRARPHCPDYARCFGSLSAAFQDELLEARALRPPPALASTSDRSRGTLM